MFALIYCNKCGLQCERLWEAERGRSPTRAQSGCSAGLCTVRFTLQTSPIKMSFHELFLFVFYLIVNRLMQFLNPDPLNPDQETLDAKVRALIAGLLLLLSHLFIVKHHLSKVLLYSSSCTESKLSLCRHVQLPKRNINGKQSRKTLLIINKKGQLCTSRVSTCPNQSSFQNRHKWPSLCI